MFSLRFCITLMNLLILYWCILLLFYHSFSITDSLPCTTLTKPSLQHVWAFTTAHVWCLPSWTHYQLLHQPSFIYLMDIWPMICIVTFPFLVTQCAPLWPDQSQVIMPCGQGICCCFTTDEPCAWFLYYHVYLTCLYFTIELWTREILSPTVQTEEVCSAWLLCAPFFWCTFTLPCMSAILSTLASLHFMPFPISHSLTPQSHRLYLLHHVQRQSLTPLSHPQTLIGLTLWLSLITCSLWSKLCPWHIILEPTMRE